jgi:hypothetical protein
VSPVPEPSVVALIALGAFIPFRNATSGRRSRRQAPARTRGR